MLKIFCQAYKLYFRVNNHVSKGVHFNLKRLEVGLIHKGIVKNFQLIIYMYIVNEPAVNKVKIIY